MTFQPAVDQKEKKESARVFELQKKPFDPPSATERIDRLERLGHAIEKQFASLQEAINQDLGRHPSETKLLELLPTMEEIRFAIKNIEKWMSPKSVPTPLTLFGTRSKIYPTPRGTVLIISPWNYPIFCSVGPLIGALAAGNRAILKPSELSPATSMVIEQIIRNAFDESEVAVFQGDHEMAEHLLRMPFDSIFFTGSTRVGKLVMTAAAKNLTPATLELGGKSPALIEDSADLKNASLKIAWGKFCNSGQTCVAPDYVLVSANKKNQFLEAICRSIGELYGSKPESSPHLARIVNRSHFDRLRKMTDESLQRGAKIHVGGVFNEKDCRISPTVLTDVKGDMPIMESEIFGPLLPVVEYDDLQEAIDFIRRRPHPLAFYIFSDNASQTEKIISRTNSGGVCVNDTLIHLGNSNLPFGGVGGSGMGNYHGKFGFSSFSYDRPVLVQTRWNFNRYLYPPYTPRAEKILSFLLKKAFRST
jgi:aldehyde dehydrogenase (NAD+)